MGHKKRSKQSRLSGNISSHTKRDTEEPNEEESAVQTKSTNEERRKGIEIVERVLQEKQKKGDTDDDRTLCLSYWNSMSIDWKNDFLRVRVSDLKSHFSNDTSLRDFLAEALSYTESNKSWKVWFCCNCSQEFSDSESHNQHVVQEHVGDLLPEMQRIVPQTVDNDWIEMIRSCSWKPLNAAAAVKMLENEEKPKEGDEVERSEAYSFADGWPVSDDSERAKLLRKIRGGIEMVIKRNHLSATHLNRLIQFAKDKIQGTAAGSQLLDQHLGQSPTCICFLEAPQLDKILNSLVGMFLVMNKDESTDPIDDLLNSNDIPEIEEKIVLSEDASCLLLDECFVPAEMTGATDNAARDDVVLLNFLSWILSGSSRDQLTLEDKRRGGLKLVETLKKDFDRLQKLCEKKTELMNSAEAMQVVEELCLEGKKRENFTESVLRKRKEELIEIEKDVISVGNEYESDAITKVLQAADKMNVNQPGSSCQLESQMDSHIETAIQESSCQLESQMDSHIKTAIQELKENLSKELNIIDVEIMEMVAMMQQWELKLGHLSAFDYRVKLLPLVNMYLRACLKDLAVKDAQKKSDAAAEALLAEVTLEDSKKKVVKAASNKKPKDKKRNKEKSKTQNLKEQPIGETHDDDSEQVEFKEDKKEPGGTLELRQKNKEVLVYNDVDVEQLFQDEEQVIRQCKIISLDEAITEVQEETRKHEEEVRKHIEEARKHEEEVIKHKEEARKHEEETRKHEEEARKHEEEAAKLKEKVREMLDSMKQLENEDKWEQVTRGKRKA